MMITIMLIQQCFVNQNDGNEQHTHTHTVQRRTLSLLIPNHTHVSDASIDDVFFFLFDRDAQLNDFIAFYRSTEKKKETHSRT